MKIIQVIPFFGLGGAEIMCETLVYELRKLGHEVVVISLYDKQSAVTDRMEKKNVDIRYLHKKSGFDFSLYRKLTNIFRQEKPDVIHTHLYSSEYVFPVATLLGIRVVHTVHSIATKEQAFLSRKFNKIFFNQFGIIPVALSENVQKTIIDEYRIDEKKVPIVFNGIDLSRCLVKTDYNVCDNFKILHIGRFCDVKNHIGLVKAFKLFHNKYGNSELWLIGDGVKLNEIKEFVKSSNLFSSVRFLGAQDNVYTYLHDADIFTLPSIYEGIPMSLIEAMGSGLPIVATSVGGIPNMLDDNSALLVSVNPIEISMAFERYLLDDEMRKRHGKAALGLATKFSSCMMAQKYVGLYFR